MTEQAFKCSIYTDISPSAAFAMISRVSDWWVKDVKGKTSHINDEFTVTAGTTWKSFRITEVIPDKKMVWLVTDCHLPWNDDLQEWKGTEIVWEISNQNDATRISFSHLGLPELDCGNQCMNAWTGYIQQSLYKLITEGKGMPNKF